MRLLRISLIVGLLAVVGCQPRHLKPRQRDPQTEAERNFETLWRSARRVLKKYGFEQDRQDRRDGIITTFAASGGHVFEVWRKDSATPFHYQENAIQNILRAVRVSLRRGEGDTFDFSVEVLMARSNLPQPMITDTSDLRSSRLPNMPRLRFNDLRRRAPSPQEPLDDDRPLGALDEPVPLEESIVPLGRDTDMEMRITSDIRETVETYDLTHEAFITPPHWLP
jgi:hypothetical protein